MTRPHYHITNRQMQELAHLRSRSLGWRFTVMFLVSVGIGVTVTSLPHIPTSPAAKVVASVGCALWAAAAVCGIFWHRIDRRRRALMREIEKTKHYPPGSH